MRFYQVEDNRGRDGLFVIARDENRATELASIYLENNPDTYISKNNLKASDITDDMVSHDHSINDLINSGKEWVVSLQFQCFSLNDLLLESGFCSSPQWAFVDNDISNSNSVPK